ncbi:alpha/beta fold hydrolase [Rhizohabitans arisaemae]|uniref:alpha/beta fold hydrolase n=1 Tax=Rhizohabitans arisaemae TaxID=2720610 RepID=UPI0024B1AF98|nr:alpha/beta hydrolase [Rhizohabitans arisaemae]
MTRDIFLPNGVRLGAQSFGDPADQAILLAGRSMTSWEDGFCERLADGGRFVVRYDPRDAGRSTGYPPGVPGYSLRDLAADAVGVLDAFGVTTAHVVGASSGGWTAQLLALDHPRRLDSLTLISTRPTAPGPADPDLPEHDRSLMAFFTAGEPDWSDRDSIVDHMTEIERLLTGRRFEFDEARARRLAVQDYDRTADIKSHLNNLAFADAGERWRERLGEISVRTLVIHGTDDPFFPYGNGVALAKEIPGAELVPLEGLGHGFPPQIHDFVVDVLLRHTAPH